MPQGAVNSGPSLCGPTLIALRGNYPFWVGLAIQLDTSQRQLEPHLIPLPSSMGVLVGVSCGTAENWVHRTQWAGHSCRMLGCLPQEGDTSLLGPAQGPVTNYTEPGTPPRPLDSVDLACGNIPHIFPTLQAPLSSLVSPNLMTSEANAGHMCPHKSHREAASLALPKKYPRRLTFKLHLLPSTTRKQEIPLASRDQTLLSREKGI